jgi:glucosamine kinase
MSYYFERPLCGKLGKWQALKGLEMSIYLGIDGGGTKTVCAVGNESRVLGTGVSGGSNIVRLGETQARASIQAAILKACRIARIDPSVVEATCIGVAGATAPNVSESIQTFVAEVVPGSILVVGDNEIAHEAAFAGGAGVIVASGTGSIAYGRNEVGEMARAGGHGFAISDEGSGYWVGRTAVSAAMHARDRGQPTVLLSAIGKALGARAQEDIVKLANSSPSPDFAALFPVVVAAAETGDLVALEVLRSAGVALSELAAAVIKRLWPTECGVRVAMAGGVFQFSAEVRQEFRNALRSAYPSADVSLSVVDPVLGSLSLARKEHAKQGALASGAQKS